MRIRVAKKVARLYAWDVKRVRFGTALRAIAATDLNAARYPGPLVPEGQRYGRWDPYWGEGRADQCRTIRRIRVCERRGFLPVRHPFDPRLRSDGNCLECGKTCEDWIHRRPRGPR